MSKVEILEEIVEDLTTKLSSYVKSYESSLVQLKVQALEALEEKDRIIEELRNELAAANEVQQDPSV